jgi:acyl carrier protein
MGEVMSMHGGAVAASTALRAEETPLKVRERVRKFIIDNFYVSDPSEVGDDVSLITSGLVDSTGMLEVIAFLESEYGFHVEEQETTPDNLETVGRIAGFVIRKRRSQASDA